MCLGPQSDRLGPVISKLCIMPCQCRYVCSGEACSLRSHWGSTPVALIPIIRFLFFSPDATIYLNRLIGSFLLSPFPALLFLSSNNLQIFALIHSDRAHCTASERFFVWLSGMWDTRVQVTPHPSPLCHRCPKPLDGLLSDHGRKWRKSANFVACSVVIRRE